MSGNLDRSLDDILSTRRQSSRRGRGRRVPNGRARAATAPVGGIKKASRDAKAGTKAVVPSGPAAVSGDSKIIVSNLPPDVNEGQIKEYFVKSVGPVKRVTITYGPNGVSRGIATIIFNKVNSASDALTKLNGLLVDKRPMKIEVVLDASRAPPPAPVKGLSDRIAQPKGQPKPATATKIADGSSTRGGRGRGRARRGRNAGRPKPKTADELDAEMEDYFDPEATNGATNAAAPTTNGTAQPTATGGDDLGMDEI
ncbi:hypothetical protein MMC20_006881 [Loxospora ochrophaea]|nr:hypothetical protein [Loxospora ochrophaea]